MQILITVGEEGHATTQVLGAAPIGETPAYTSLAGEPAFDAGAGPTEGEELEAELGRTAPEAKGASMDGGSAPAELEQFAEPTESTPPIEAGASKEADTAPEISDSFLTESGPPTLRPVD